MRKARLTGHKMAAALVFVLITASTEACGFCGYNTYVETHGTLSGSEVVPSVESSNGGTILALSVALNEGSWASESMLWRMTTSLSSDEVTAVHVHEGVAGQNGAILFTLPDRFLSQSDTFIVGASMDYEGSMSTEDLIELLRFGGAYVDIHTHRHPGGEVRAQLQLTKFEDRSGYYCS